MLLHKTRMPFPVQQESKHEEPWKDLFVCSLKNDSKVSSQSTLKTARWSYFSSPINELLSKTANTWSPWWCLMKDIVSSKIFQARTINSISSHFSWFWKSGSQMPLLKRTQRSEPNYKRNLHWFLNESNGQATFLYTNSLRTCLDTSMVSWCWETIGWQNNLSCCNAAHLIYVLKFYPM